MKKLLKSFRYGQKGFTLVELLVVVAILGVLAAVAIPNVGKFIDRGKNESYETELHNIQTAVMAMLADSVAGELDAASVGVAVYELNLITADTSAISLDEYMTGLGDSPKTDLITETTAPKSGCAYTFTVNGTVTQTLP